MSNFQEMFLRLLSLILLLYSEVGAEDSKEVSETTVAKTTTTEKTTERQEFDHNHNFNYCLRCEEGEALSCKQTDCRRRENATCEHYDGGNYETFRLFMIDRHNELRNEIALGKVEGFPEAANMYELYSDEFHLQRLADCNVLQCEVKHDPCKITPNFPRVGQNIHQENNLNRSNGIGYENIIKEWYDGIKEFVKSQQQIDKYVPNPATEQFTQMIWANTSAIGCSRSIGIKDEGFFMTTCNYGQGGNVPGESIYKKGKPCSDCRKGCSENWRYPALCRPDLKKFYSDDEKIKPTEKPNATSTDKAEKRSVTEQIVLLFLGFF